MILFQEPAVIFFVTNPVGFCRHYKKCLVNLKTASYFWNLKKTRLSLKSSAQNAAAMNVPKYIPLAGGRREAYVCVHVSH